MFAFFWQTYNPLLCIGLSPLVGVLGLVEKPRILCVGSQSGTDADTVSRLRQDYEVVEAPTPLRALSRLTNETFAGVYFFGDSQKDALRLARFMQSERILERIPEGVALLDVDNCIVWANDRIRHWIGQAVVEGENLYKAFS